jgi:hypothetical protein
MTPNVRTVSEAELRIVPGKSRSEAVVCGITAHGVGLGGIDATGI